MPEAITFESFLTKDPLDNYEDHEKYTKEWLPKIENIDLIWKKPHLRNSLLNCQNQLTS